MIDNSDALVIGAGPAGASAAILLAQAGWRVSLVEQHVYPRQKVCGECIAAGNFALLDELGIGATVRRIAGAELKQVGWMHRASTIQADMPPCMENADRYGRALGRDVFDSLLMARARAAGVYVLQPARVVKVSGQSGEFGCDLEVQGMNSDIKSPKKVTTIGASLIIDAHGSWESGPQFDTEGEVRSRDRSSQLASDLFAFKATFSNSALTPGLLPVLAFKGGYGGMVIANEGRMTLALCLRRDALRALRAQKPGLPAGLATEAYARESCHGVRDALRDAHRTGSWLTVGPLRPGMRLRTTPGIFRVGNASGESHPLIGEGITMALQSSKLLVENLLRHQNRLPEGPLLGAAQRAYARAWREAFLPRMRLAALYAHVAMRTPLAVPVAQCLQHWPSLLTTAARLAGKGRPAFDQPHLTEELI